MKHPIPNLVLAITAAFFGVAPLPAQGVDLAGERVGPGAAPVDRFHPDREVLAEPASGGRVIVRLPTMPRTLNRVLENSSVVTALHHEIHETLVQQDWEYHDVRPNLCTSWDTEDQLLIAPGAALRYPAATRIGEGETERFVVFGACEETEEGWRVVPRSASNPLEEPLVIDASDVLRVERGTVFTFHLKDEIRWHDGHLLDADDVLFTWSLYGNPHVKCEQTRSSYRKVLAGEAPERLIVRFFYEHQYFKALDVVGKMCILPRHLYDLTDPDHDDHDPDTAPSEEELAAYVNENPRNSRFVGLGPYRITAFETQYIEAERVDGYRVSERSGYLKTIRWRHIADDDAAFQALVNGEIDFLERMSSAHYFGEATVASAFTERFYKGYLFTGAYGYTCWNLRRSKLADERVRRALAHAFDASSFLQSAFSGLGIPVTGSQNYFGPGYDHATEALAHDAARAEELLAEAGWIDRDGDGILDRDGVPLELEFLMSSGNAVAEIQGLLYQEALGKLGVRMTLTTLEWGSFFERVLARDFDCFNLAWVPPLESDPAQLWHSRNAGAKTSNHAGFADPEADRLIEAIQVELDPGARATLMHELHRLIYARQPYLFGINPPSKFAMSRAIRGFQGFKIAPGYSIRRWFYPG